MERVRAQIDRYWGSHFDLHLLLKEMYEKKEIKRYIFMWNTPESKEGGECIVGDTHFRNLKTCVRAACYMRPTFCDGDGIPYKLYIKVIHLRLDTQGEIIFDKYILPYEKMT